MPEELIYGPFISWSQANSQGLKHYFTGKPCKWGHIALRITKGECTECLAEGRYRATTEQIRVNMRRHRAWQRAADTTRISGTEQVCKHCGKTWMRPFGSSRKYCSDECSRLAINANGRRTTAARYEANPHLRAKKREQDKSSLANRREDPAYDSAYLASGVDYQRQRRKVDPAFLLRTQLGNRLNAALKSQNVERSFALEDIVGCTMAELKRHLEEQFESGMSWDERSAWHIDHIKPCKLFDHNDIKQVKECWNWSNLRPLWAEDNLKKGGRWFYEDC